MIISVRVPRIFRLLAIAILATNANLAAGSEPLKLAFVGDQGTNNNSQAVLQLIVDEGSDLLLVQGDFAYDDNAAGAWISNMDDILGERFPVLITVGNHDLRQWPIYREWQKQRIANLADLQCDGSPGVMAHCTYRGVSVIQIAPGIRKADGISPDDDYNGYLDITLATDRNLWRFCSWHKLQKDMQVGGKSNETGWNVYQTCLKHGGIVATGHEHTYSRTYLMRDFQAHDVVHRGDHLDIKPGQSFAFVSGLGGQDIRDQELYNDWWGSIYTSTQDAEHGVLFCTLDGADADCYFKDINGTVPDRFTLHIENPLTIATTENEQSSLPVDQSISDNSTIEDSAADPAVGPPTTESTVDVVEPVASIPTADTDSVSATSQISMSSGSTTGAGGVSIYAWLMTCIIYLRRRFSARKSIYALS